MARQAHRPKKWTECPCCGFPVAAGYTSCTQCGHGASSWRLIQAVKALPGTRDLGFSDTITEDKPTTPRGPK